MRIKVYRNDGEFDVMICRNKLTDTFSFVYLTKQHICVCQFNSIEEALEDLNNDPRVIVYTIVQ